MQQRAAEGEGGKGRHGAGIASAGQVLREVSCQRSAVDARLGNAKPLFLTA